jgi:excisionase family DNA binding protein
MVYNDTQRIPLKDGDYSLLDDFLTVYEVSRHLKISPNTVRRLVKTGKLPYYRVGNQIRIKKADLEKFRQEGMK